MSSDDEPFMIDTAEYQRAKKFAEKKAKTKKAVDKKIQRMVEVMDMKIKETDWSEWYAVDFVWYFETKNPQTWKIKIHRYESEEESPILEDYHSDIYPDTHIKVHRMDRKRVKEYEYLMEELKEE